MPYDNQPEQTDYAVGDATERPIFYPSVEDLPLPGADLAPTLDPSAFGQNIAAFDEEVQTSAESFNRPARTVKHRTVMSLAVTEIEDLVCYQQTGLEDGDKAECIYVTKEIFEEMGNPLIVTVSVRPGDHLN